MAKNLLFCVCHLHNKYLQKKNTTIKTNVSVVSVYITFFTAVAAKLQVQGILRWRPAKPLLASQEST